MYQVYRKYGKYVRVYGKYAKYMSSVLLRLAINA